MRERIQALLNKIVELQEETDAIMANSYDQSVDFVAHLDDVASYLDRANQDANGALAYVKGE
jgi:hypothetical protein